MYSKKGKGWIKHLDFTIIDLICAELAIYIGVYYRFQTILFLDHFDYYQIYEALPALVALIDIAAVFFTEAYTGILRRNKYQEFTATLGHCLINFGGVLVYMYATAQARYVSRIFYAAFGISMFVLTYAARVLWKRLVRRIKLQDKNKTLMLVAADRANMDVCLNEIAHNKYTNFKVCGVIVLDEDMTGQEIQGIPVVASLDTILDYARTNVVDEIYIDGYSREVAEELSTNLVELGLTVHLSVLHADQSLPNRLLENYGNYVVLTTSMHIATNRQVVIKRLMDIVGALVGLLFTLIAFLIFAPIIKIQSPGPVFFKQTRIGLNGRRFKFYKFRSMYVDAEERKKELMAQNEMSGNMFKMENDPRIIPIGHFMRKHSIDELPQFWNVLKGDMSLVGTRPPTEDEFENYAAHHKARLGIKPGLTGMWQISGRSDIKDFENVVAIDTEYISNWSLGLDVKIIFKTVSVVFTGKGSK